MSEEEMNQELSTDNLKDVAGGYTHLIGGQMDEDAELVGEAKSKWTNRLTTKDKFDKATSNVNGIIGYE